MRLINQVAVFLVVVLLSMGCSTRNVQKRTKVDKRSPLEIIETNNELWVKSLNENNNDFIDLYRSTSHIIDNDHLSYKGEDEISRLYKSFFSDNIKISGHKILNIQNKTDFSYFEIGQYELTGDINQTVTYGTIWNKIGEKMYKQFEMFNFEDKVFTALEDIITEIEEAEDNWEEKYHNSDVTSDLYVEDAYFYWGGSYIVKGAEDIVKEVAGGNDQLEPRFIKPVSETLVYEIGETESLNYMLSWKKVDNKWLMFIDSYIE